MPEAVLKLLRAKPKHSPSHAIAVRNPTTPGKRTRLVEGKLCCGKYATSVPASLLACTSAVEASERHAEQVDLSKSQSGTGQLQLQNGTC